jgi:hypothetical protein
VLRLKRLLLILICGCQLGCLAVKAHGDHTVKHLDHTHNHALTRSLSVMDLTKHAGLIFKGRLMSTKVHREDSINIRSSKFLVKEVYKGFEYFKGDEINLDSWASINSDLDELQTKRDYVFFFYAPHPKTGLTSMVGMSQGYAEVLDQDKLQFHTYSKGLGSTYDEYVSSKTSRSLFSRSSSTTSLNKVRTIKDLEALINTNTPAVTQKIEKSETVKPVSVKESETK